VARWERPYGPDVGFVLALILFAVGALTSVFGMIYLVTAWQWNGPYVFVVVATVALGRAVRVGLLINDGGVRIRRFWSTHTLAWDEIAAVGMLPAEFLRGPTLWIMTRRKGKFVRLVTPIRRARPHRPFRRREDQPWPTTRVLSPTEFDQVLRLLRQRAGTLAQPLHQRSDRS
jgi:hypothetical protein